MRRHLPFSCSSRVRYGNGQSLVELAMVLPILIILAIGAFEFGMMLYAHVQVANATREGAMAAAHYRANRYARVARDAAQVPASCEGVAGWSLQRAVEQAIVYRALDAQGCPQPSGTIEYSALGVLDSAPSPPWTATVTYATALDADGMPTPTDVGTVTLAYPYRLVIIGDLFPYLVDPIMIHKSVAFEYLQ